jgi:hypothetical protein
MQENGHKIKWYSRIYFLKENGRKSWPWPHMLIIHGASD